MSIIPQEMFEVSTVMFPRAPGMSVTDFMTAAWPVIELLNLPETSTVCVTGLCENEMEEFKGFLLSKNASHGAWIQFDDRAGDTLYTGWIAKNLEVLNQHIEAKALQVGAYPASEATVENITYDRRKLH